MENKPAQNIQDTFLNTVRKDKTPITIYLVSGVKLTGKIRSFDKYSVLLENNSQEQLIFKHAISTVVSNRSVMHSEHRPAARINGHRSVGGSGAVRTPGDCGAAIARERPRLAGEAYRPAASGGRPQSSTAEVRPLGWPSLSVPSWWEWTSGSARAATAQACSSAHADRVCASIRSDPGAPDLSAPRKTTRFCPGRVRPRARVVPRPRRRGISRRVSRTGLERRRPGGRRAAAAPRPSRSGHAHRLRQSGGDCRRRRFHRGRSGPLRPRPFAHATAQP